MRVPLHGKRLLPAFALLAAAAVRPAAVADLAGDVELETRRAELGTAAVAVSIRDAATGTSLFALNADQMLIPASNAKLLTTGAALHVLGPDFRFTTRLLRDGDRLIVAGDGDAGFGDPELLALMQAEGGAALDVESFLDLWVRPVAASGAERISAIVVDDRVFDRQLLHASWPSDQLNRPYCAEVAGLSFHGNVLHFFPRPADGPRPNLDLVVPRAPWVEIVNLATTRKGAADANDVWIARPRDANVFSVYGNVKFAYRTPAPVTVHDMPLFFGRLLAERLARAGIDAGPVLLATAGSPDPAGEPAAPPVTTPVGTALIRCNRDSQNLYAECLLKRLAHQVTGEPGSWATGSAIVRHAFLDRVGDSNLAATLVIADGSGLSRNNRVSASALTAWLDTFEDDQRLGVTFLESLARAGRSGTLDGRFADIDLHGTIVQAKSGYIQHVSCLSGYVTATGGARRIFSILVNDLSEPGSVGRAKKMQERIVSPIARDLAGELTAAE